MTIESANGLAMNNFSGQWLWFFDDELVHALLRVQPDNPQLTRRAAAHPGVVEAVRLWMEGMAEEAIQELAAPMAQAEPDALALSGQIHFEMGRIDKAAQAYGKLATVFPGHPYATLNLGICHARTRNWGPAVETLKSALVLHPDRAEVWFALGVALLNQKRAIEARSAFSRSLRISSEYVPALFGQAVSYQLEGSHAEALRIYERMLEAQPECEELLANALASAADLRDAAKVRMLAPRLLQLRPLSVPAHLALAWICIDQGNTSEATRHCDMVAQATPADFGQWYNFGVCLLSLGHHERAANAFERALGFHADDASAQEGLARCLSALNHTEEAKAAWERMLMQVPEREDAWYRLGLLLHEMERFTEAAAAFDRCVKIKPEWLDAWVNLGNARWSAGDTTAAASAFQRVLDVSPFHAAARRAMAALAVASGDTVAAERYVEGLSGKDWEILYNLAMLFHSSGKLARAASLYREVLAAKPDLIEARFNLGTVLFGLGRLNESQDSWKAAIAVKPELAVQIVKWMGNGALRAADAAAV
jgi:tetratricopeptide (TPR) repeat protein